MNLGEVVAHIGTTTSPSFIKGCVALLDTNSEKKFYTNSAKMFLLKIA